MKLAHRFSGTGHPYERLTKMTSHGPVWTGDIKLVPELLDQPLRWRAPRRIFIASMSDPFHEAVPDEFLDRMFAIMAMAPQPDDIYLWNRLMHQAWKIDDVACSDAEGVSFNQGE